MAGFTQEDIAVDWLLSEFHEHPELAHLRARKRGRVVTVESGPKGDVVPHVRFRRDTVHLWMLEMPGRGGKWDPTLFRDSLEDLWEVVTTQFAWTISPVHAINADGTSDPGY